MLVVPPRLKLENSHSIGTEQVVDVHLDVVGMYSMPCSEVTGSFRRELLATGGQASVEFVLHRGPGDFCCLDERVAFHVVSSAGLSPSPARWSSLLRVFVPRDDSLFICDMSSILHASGKSITSTRHRLPQQDRQAYENEVK